MLILTQDGKNLIGDNFVISYDNPMDRVFNIVYQNISNNKTIIMAKYDSMEDCLEQIGVINLMLTDNENVKFNKTVKMKEHDSIQLIHLPSAETLNKIHKNRKENGK